MIVAITLALSTSAFAQPVDKARAKEAYDRGLEAHKRGDLAKAADEFARADALAPSAVALQAALDAAIEADDAALGAELLERSKREPASPTLASSITAAHLKFRGRAGRLRVVCPRGSTCLAKVDDKPVEVDKVVWARTGQRTVIVQVDGDAHTKLVELTTDQVVDVAPVKGTQTPALRPSSADTTTPPPPPSDKPKHSVFADGLPPIFFYAGVGLTVVLAGATTYLMVDTSSKHEDFKNAGCERANFASCAELKDEGESRQQAANIGIAVTAVAGIATAILGIGLTNWKGPLIAVHPGGGGASWRATF